MKGEITNQCKVSQCFHFKINMCYTAKYRVPTVNENLGQVMEIKVVMERPGNVLEYCEKLTSNGK